MKLAISIVSLGLTLVAGSDPQWVGLYPQARDTQTSGLYSAYDPASQQVVLLSPWLSNPLWSFDGVRWTQRNSAHLPVGRNWPAFSPGIVPGQMLLFGGNTAIGSVGQLQDTWLWDGNDWIQRFPATKPATRHGAAMMADPARSNVVLFGGLCLDVTQSGFRSDTLTWDGTNWNPRTPAHKPPARAFSMMAYDALRQKVVMFGGATDLNYFGDVWEWDGTDWNQVAASGPPGRAGAAFAYDPVRKVVWLYGGHSQSLNTETVYGDLWSWNGSVWTQATFSAGPGKRYQTTMSFDTARSVLTLHGGTVPMTGAVNDTWTWDGVTWTQVDKPVEPGEGYWPALATDPIRKNIVFFGGSNGPNSSNTFLWDGTKWALQQVFPAPPSGYGAAMAFDPLRSEIVLHGGCSGTPVSGTWTWNGAAWTPKQSQTSPGPRCMHGMAFDAVRGQVVLHGGNFARDTWVWNGTDWTLKTSSGPEFFGKTLMAYDEKRQQVVIFGEELTGAPGGTTFVWNGNSWDRKLAGSPAQSLTNGSMAYDPVREKIVLNLPYDSTGNSNGRSETWLWDGAQWQKADPAISPPMLFSAMAYDPIRRQVMLFGGHDSTSGETWFWSDDQNGSSTLVTVSSSSSYCPYAVDGISYSGNHLFSWVPLSTHTISASNQMGLSSRCVFGNWSDGGAATHDIVAPATSAAFRATFAVQHRLTVTPAPAERGSITVTPFSSDGFYDAGTSVTLLSAAKAGSRIGEWLLDGATTGIGNPIVIRMDSPVSATNVFYPAVSRATPARVLLKGVSGSPYLYSCCTATPIVGGVALASDLSLATTETQTFLGGTDASGGLWIAQTFLSGLAPWVNLHGISQGNPMLAPFGPRAVIRDPWDGYWLMLSQWTNLGGVFASDPVVASGPGGGAYVIGKDKWGAIWTGRYSPTEGFQGWRNRGGIVSGKPAAVVGQDGILYIAVRDAWNALWLARVHGDNLLGWTYGGGSARNDPSIAAVADGTVKVAVLDQWGGAYVRSFTQGLDGQWQPWRFVGGILQNLAIATANDEVYLVGLASGRSFYWHKLDAGTWTGVILPEAAVASSLSAGPVD